MMDTRTVRTDPVRRHSISATEAIEKERQRKFLIQVQKSRILAAAQILHSTNKQTTISSTIPDPNSPKTDPNEISGTTKLDSF